MDDAGSPGLPGLTTYGFDGPEDYIEQITYRIWNQPHRDVSAISSYYSPTTRIHLDGSDLVGDRSVVSNTEDRLRTFPDFHGVIDDTVWTGSEREGYRTSMRWTWTGTDTGGSVFGPATGRRVRFVAIANCVVRGRTIVEEWLGSNPLALARQLGVDTATAVRATVPGERPPVLPRVSPGVTDAGVLVRDALAGALATAPDVTAFAEDCASMLAPDRDEVGTAAVARWGQEMRDRLGPVEVVVDDQYEQGDGSVVRVATQARLVTADLQLSLIAHHHVREGRVVAQWLTYDELKLAHLGLVA